jgi:transcriptional regulator with XRE-family HTH domain
MKNTIKFNGCLNAIGGKIKEYRIKNNFTQEQLTAKLQILGININKNSLQKIEKGNRIIKEYELTAFSVIFNVSADELLEDCKKSFIK